jgi:sugar lactone lactonase YvrE
MAIDIDIDTRVEAVLGEGALWDDEAGELLTIDMISGAVDRTPFRAGLLESRRRIVGDYVGAVLLADSPGFVAVTRVGLELVGPEESTSLGTVLTDPTLRLNDAACDSRGRIWVGSTHVEVLPGLGGLHAWSAEHGTTVAADGLTLPNGIGWSPEDETIYLADSGRSVVLSATFDSDSGRIGPLRELFTVDGGEPDGLCVAADGTLWVAIWDGGRVEHRSPNGRLIESVPVPVSRPTSCALLPGIGLAITTARLGLDAQELATQPAAGHLLVVRGDGAGLPVARVRTGR